MKDILQTMLDSAIAHGPSVLLEGNQLRRPIDVLNAPALATDDKRAILAAWASDRYAVHSKPPLRQLPGTPEPVSIDEIQSVLTEIDRRYSY
ncbi:hypothetical protein A6U86_32360 [Rhizobium sp. AC27/96]|uniref:hypothetical protein n=1 Tax=Rhizobium TaxID=379 RepID=UPI000828CE09|nr:MULTISPECIES: hypothetical protein [Rhizobium]OCJ02311.1 hypothetical protein A6U86_32360 [Rhizobium sp. AC27/96]